MGCQATDGLCANIANLTEVGRTWRSTEGSGDVGIGHEGAFEISAHLDCPHFQIVRGDQHGVGSHILCKERYLPKPDGGDSIT